MKQNNEGVIRSAEDAQLVTVDIDGESALILLCAYLRGHVVSVNYLVIVC
jgi:hypothetical protein